MSQFDPNAFLHAEVNEVSKKRNPLPVGEYSAILGEGKIVGDDIIFNMTPSPGASVCLYNAMRDAEQIAKFVPAYMFDKAAMMQDLCIPQEQVSGGDVSLKETYAS